jgi:23S rRNA G2445 N2-methylase RlmL
VRARPYAFEHLRAVHDRRWVEAALTPPGDTPSILFALARDIDPEACRAANGNLRAAGFSNQSSVVQSDVFDEASGDVALPAPAVGVERWLIVNPPYGERLRAASGAARGSEKLSDFYGRLAARAEALARPARAGFLLPANADPKRIRWPKAWTRAAEPLPLSNGGLSVAFHVFTRL